jgi:hypothetical protein
METTIEKPRQSWLRSHWKLILGVWLGLALSGGIFAVYWLDNSEATKLALRTAESNLILAERIGRPLKRGWFVRGTIEVTSFSGHAELEIPVSGPKGHGTIYTESRKRNGVWQLQMLQFAQKESGERFDLLTVEAGDKSTAVDSTAQNSTDHDEFVFVRRQIKESHSFMPKNGCVPDSETAVAIAYAVALPVYGKETVDAEKPFRAELEGGRWTVLGTFHGKGEGGTVIVQIDKTSGQIRYLGHSM